MPVHDTYTVVVEFATSTDREIGHEFCDAQQFERTDTHQYQDSYGVVASTAAEAYRRAANLVEVQLAVAAVQEVAILSGHVYGPGGEEVFD